jgi:hypothetical protein
LLAPLLLLQYSWFSGLVVWWSCWVLAFSFHSSWVVWLGILFFFFNYYLSLSPEFLSSTCSTLLEWPSTVLFVWLYRLLISRISVWFFLLRFSKSVINSSFIFCSCVFCSCISLFIVSFYSFWCLLRSSLSSFICFCVSRILCFWCLNISWVHLVHSG